MDFDETINLLARLYELDPQEIKDADVEDFLPAEEPYSPDFFGSLQRLYETIIPDNHVFIQTYGSKRWDFVAQGNWGLSLGLKTPVDDNEITRTITHPIFEDINDVPRHGEDMRNVEYLVQLFVDVANALETYTTKTPQPVPLGR